MTFLKKPSGQLYVLKEHLFNIHNVADSEQYASIKSSLSKPWYVVMKSTNEPRLDV